MNREISPAAAYLTGLIRAFVTGQDPPAPPETGIDWAHLRDLLLRRGLLPTLGPLVLQNAVTPDPIRQEIEALCRNLRRRSALFLLELSRVLPALEAAGAHPVVLKGAALAQTVYGAGSRRYFADLDILVRRTHIEESCRQLRSFGYEFAETGRDTEFYARHHFHWILQNKPGMTVEIHWDLTRPDDFFRFDIDGLFERCRRVDAGAESFRTLCTADQLLHAAAQALREGFLDSRRIIDSALLLRAGAEDDRGLCRRAREQGLGTALWLLLTLVHGVTGIGPRPDTAAALRPDGDGWSRRCLESLDLETALLTVEQRRRSIKPLVQWLCAPGAGGAIGEIRRFLWPDEGHFLDEGLTPGDLPGLSGRLLLATRRTVSLSRLAGYQALCLATRRGRQRASA